MSRSSSKSGCGKFVMVFIAIICLLGIIGAFVDSDDDGTTSVSTAYKTEETYEDTTEETSASAAETTTSEKNSAVVTQEKTTSTTTKINDEFELTMLNVGQGLSILIKADGKYMLYDGGGRSHSSYVVSYLKRHNITELTYVFASHYDEDHIAGLVGVLNTTKVDTVVDPDYTADSKIYGSFCTKLAANGAKEIHPSVGSSYKLGKATITVLSPKNYNYDNENSFSVAVRITYGVFSAIITGDAEAEAEADMLASGLTLDSDLYVVGHHGSSSSSSASFVKRISPAYAFISVGDGNSYGHPTYRTMNTLKKNGVQVFRSDKQGEVTCYSDGEEYWFSTDPCNDYSAGVTTAGKAA